MGVAVAGRGGAGVEIEFVAVDGGVRRQPLAECLSVRFEDVAPARSFPSYRGQRNFPGWWWSSTMGRHVGYESWLERDHVMLLDFDPQVTAFASQPFWLHWAAAGRARRHLPDYFARQVDGVRVVIDVRADDRIEPADAEAFAATAAACEAVGWQFRRVGTLDGVFAVRDYVNRVRAHPADTKSVRHLVSRADLFTKIRDEAVGVLASRLAAQFSTDRATVIRALTGEDTPRKRSQSKQNPILEDLRHHIDKMIDADPHVTVATIWERLVDQHHAEVSYATVRDYVARERRQPRPRSKPSTTTIPAQSKPRSGAPSVRRPGANAIPGQAR